jgi:hypothetical protein
MKQTLANAIIHQDATAVAQFLSSNDTDIEEYDEYGYIPLVEAAIVNKTDIAKLLLEKGAKANSTDLTGRTALHWAADNNNLELCQLLLEHGADANAYTIGGFSVMIMPVLRQQQPLKQLLLQHNASLLFAQDFINTKLLGHRYELVGTVDIVNHEHQFVEMEYAGFFLEFTMDVVRNSLSRYLKNFAARPYQNLFPLAENILYCLQNASEIIRYQHYQLDLIAIENRIDTLFNHMPLLIPLGFEGHAICFIQLGDTLIKCDRGAASKRDGSVVFYRIHNPSLFNHAFLKHLVYKKQSRRFIEQELPRYLNLEAFDSLPIPSQLIGNCSWANLEVSVVAILYLLLQNHTNFSKQYQQRNKDIALNFYYAWLEWDKDRALEEAVNRFEGASKARKASIAATLGAVLFQSCDDLSQKGIERAEKILPILHTPGYEYVLRSYVKAYIYGLPDERGKNFHDLLDTCGVDINKFR